MKNTTLKLVFALCFSIFIGFTAILGLFHFSMKNHIKANAHQAIQYTISSFFSPYMEDGEEIEEESSENASSEEISAIASYILVDKNYNTTIDNIYSKKQKDIAKWFAEHPTPEGNITHLKLNKRKYFAAQIKTNKEIQLIDGIWIIYVDVTPEIKMVASIDLAILIIMLLSGISTALTGMRIGLNIEKDQKKQKQFFENASHELKTPLMSIQGYAEGIHDGVIKDQEHAISVILNETDKMTSLVDEILCLSRIESGETKLSLEKVSVQDVVNNCLVSIETMVMKKGIVLEANIEKGFVSADPMQFETAVMNLLTNAVKYTKSRIIISYNGKELKIWNDGSCISKEEAINIFERFYIGKNGNTGIGLALTKEIVEKHGWKIYANSIYNGTQFVINFSSWF